MIFRTVNSAPCDTRMRGTCHRVFVKTHGVHDTKSEPSPYMSSGLWVVWRVRLGSSVVTNVPPAGDADSGELRTRSTWELCVPRPRLFCEPKTILKIILKKWSAHSELSYINSKWKIQLWNVSPPPRGANWLWESTSSMLEKTPCPLKVVFHFWMN